ncbi:MAG: hypothetical protein K8S13_12010 [Desulfobacula sp.]|uniref:hypothetical protein n=1 Tax=Desulfobacula sp. TaxID=2593537 RepID=UPI0025C54E04|nr:hypothetical protein [Desulfobacula sp.]MCD4720565.1 hypothetical protein [Desulfobacula sp.]
MYQLIFYVPATHLEEVKEALFNVGAGKYKKYDKCCWQIKGKGQFRPLNSSKPFIGKLNKLEEVDEYKVEMIVKDELVKTAVAALIKAHPYEEPAYSVLKIQVYP